MRKLKVIILMWAILLITPFVQAVEEAALEDAPASDVGWEATFKSSNHAIAEWFDGVVEGVDLFLVGKRLTDRANNSSIRIENSTYSSEGKPVDNVTSISINPRFVNLEEYLHLKFTSYDEREQSRGIQNGYLRQTPREKNYGATIGLFRKLGNIRTAFQPRIELQDPLKVSHSLSFESIAETKNFYRINPKLELYASPTKGVGTYQGININFDLTKSYALTFINESDYQEKSHAFAVTNGVSLGEAVTDTSSFAYTVLFLSNNQPKYHLDGYTFSVAWSESIYSGMIDYAIVPHLDFILASRFKGSAGLAITFNLNFL